MKSSPLKYLFYILLLHIPFVGTMSQQKEFCDTTELAVLFNQKTNGIAEIKLGKKVQITGMAFSPDDKLLATGGYKEVCLWNLESPGLQKRFTSPLIEGHVKDIEFIDQETLVIGCGLPGVSGQVHIIDLKRNEIIMSFSPSKDVISKVAVSPIKNIISAADANGNVFLFNTLENKLLCQAEKLNSEITGLAFTKDSSKISYCSFDGQMMVWDYKKQSSYHYSTYQREMIGFQNIKKDKSAVIVINNEQKRTIQAISINNNTGDIKRIKKNKTQNKTISLGVKKPTTLVSFNKGIYHAVGCSDGTVMFYSAGNTVMKLEVHGHNDWISSMHLSHNEAMMASADAKGIIKIWSFTNKKQLLSLIQIANGSDEWIALSSRGYYNGSSAELLQWKDKDNIPPYMQNKLFNPVKLNELFNISQLKAPQSKNKSKR